jgi:hypothetical protein
MQAARHGGGDCRRWNQGEAQAPLGGVSNESALYPLLSTGNQKRQKTLIYQCGMAVEAVISELVSVSPFPVLRENTGKFVEFRRRATIEIRLRIGNSIAYQPNSLSIGSGKLFA